MLAEANLLVAPIAALVGVWLGTHLSRKSWLRQRQWTSREKYYLDLVTYLTRAELSLQAQSEYHEGPPGSEYGDHSDNETFRQLGRAASEALHSVKELTGPAEVFLSQGAMGALHELLREEWHANAAAVHPSEYIQKTLTLVRSARAAVIEAAKAELASA